MCGAKMSRPWPDALDDEASADAAIVTSRVRA
jgi:hypothetical protein